MRLVGHPEVIDEPWFGSAATRAQHADPLDDYVASWIAARDLAEVVTAFEEAEAAVAPIYDIAQIMEDPQYRALDTITTVDDPDLGPVRMQNVMFRLSETPGAIRWTGRSPGADNEAVYCGALGLTPADLERLRSSGVI